MGAKGGRGVRVGKGRKGGRVQKVEDPPPKHTNQHEIAAVFSRGAGEFVKIRGRKG